MHGEDLELSEIEALERAALNEERATRRARAAVRRFAVRNQLCVMWTLTFAPENVPADRREAFREGWRFVRRLRDHLGTELAYVVAYERGERGTKRAHLHMLVPAWVHNAFQWPKGNPRESPVGRLWGVGGVLYSDYRRQGGSVRDRSRRAAAYVSKYVSKDLGAERKAGSQRYRVAQGFQVRVVRRTGLRLTEAVRFAASDIEASGLVPVLIGCEAARDGPVAALVVGRTG